MLGKAFDCCLPIFRTLNLGVIMKKTNLLMAASTLLISSQAMAHIPPGGVVLDFNSGRTVSLTDSTGTAGLSASVFPAFGQYYSEKGVWFTAIGFGTDPGFSNNVGVFTGGSHVHSQDPDGNGNFVAELAGDSGGAVYQLADGDAFAMAGLDVANLTLNNNFTSLTLRGYTDSNYTNWHDVILSQDNTGAITVDDGGMSVDTETGAGFRGTHVHLDDVADFGKVYLFEYFFNDKDGNSWRGVNPNSNINISVDNVEIAPATVPVPAAVYLFGSALFGMMSLGRKRSNSKA